MTTSLTSENFIHHRGTHGTRAVRSLAYLMAAALIASAAVSTLRSTAPERAPDASARSPMVGVFTGEFVNGVPVYRLPPIAVVGRRESELAGMPREHDLARESQGQARATARVLVRTYPTR